MSQLSAADRQKLDQYLTSVREVEKQLQMSQAWLEQAQACIDDRCGCGRRTHAHRGNSAVLRPADSGLAD